jgi:A/G-specific adenine glycosylase
MAYETRGAKNISQTPGQAHGQIPGLQISEAVLRWYDANARVLPWRIGPHQRKAGHKPDPYAVWLSEIMLQQTTVASVAPRFLKFLTRWPDVAAMAAADIDDVLGEWAGLGYYARARNLHKCAGVVVSEHGGDFPYTEDGLKALPGIGDYTAAAIAAIAFDRPAVVVDGNIERIVARLYAIDAPLPGAKALIKQRAGVIWPPKRSGDFAQGLMDIGAGVCKPRTPNCPACPLAGDCAAQRLGRVEDFPVKPAKKPKPSRKGAAFALVNAKGEFLFERRPEKGLLGGMLGLPGSPWTEKLGKATTYAPAATKWRRAGEVTHIFTHFHLTLDVHIGKAPKSFRRGRQQQWIAPKQARLPTVMKKALDLALTTKGLEK